MPPNGIELSYGEERLNDAKIISFFKEGESFLNGLEPHPLYVASMAARAPGDIKARE